MIFLCLSLKGKLNKKIFAHLYKIVLSRERQRLSSLVDLQDGLTVRGMEIERGLRIGIFTTRL